MGGDREGGIMAADEDQKEEEEEGVCAENPVTM